MVRGRLRFCVGLGSEPDEGARTWPLWPCRSAPAPQSTDRQGRFAPQPGSDGQLAGAAVPASGPLGLRPAPARQLLRDDAVGPLLGGLPVEVPGVALAKLPLHQLQHLLSELLAAQVPAPPQRLERFLVEGLQPVPSRFLQVLSAVPLALTTPWLWFLRAQPWLRFSSQSRKILPSNGP